MNMQIRFLGVRGSLPTPYYPETLQEKTTEVLDRFCQSPSKDVKSFVNKLPQHLKGGWGGNTTCVDIKTKKTHIIIDGGTGIRRIIQEVMSNSNDKNEIHIFFTHFHWDHIIGLPFFTPFYIKKNNIHLYAVQPELKKMFKLLFTKPYFPVTFKQLASTIHFHQLKPRTPFSIEDTKITPYLLDHPDECWGYKVTTNGKTYSHCVDTEGLRISRKDLGKDLPLYQNVDLMLYDGQYTIEEALEKLNWGHSAAPRGLEIALREKIKTIAFTHHDPWADDEYISTIAKQAQQFLKKTAEKNGFNFKVKWLIAREGMVINL